MTYSEFDLRSLVRTIPDYPKPGIMFRDVTTLMSDTVGFRVAVDQLVAHHISHTVDIVAGIEARGFILGGAVAHQLGKGFVPIRKPGKLPRQTYSEDYELEYGVDSLEIHTDALAPGQRVLLIDDLIATGGSARAAVRLVERFGAKVPASAFIIELPALGGRTVLENMGVDVHSLIDFDGE
ncbi:Adenine phosphoribosyltransferase [hydrothermal vent metagenome]|uniref:adenine phosphoribosyltransferase n=1 Tax=hydrothermal vent metagenome TaxID=652676 RepID=A0A3B0TIU4_9ZZZZ